MLSSLPFEAVSNLQFEPSQLRSGWRNVRCSKVPRKYLSEIHQMTHRATVAHVRETLATIGDFSALKGAVFFREETCVFRRKCNALLSTPPIVGDGVDYGRDKLRLFT